MAAQRTIDIALVCHMSIDQEPTFATAAEQARMIREKQISCAELLDTHLARIEALNPQLHAIVQLDADGARAAASAADDAIARGDAIGPLHGLPFTAKDWLETEGLICAAGFEERRSYVPRRDATVVARMRAAGAILLGKTKCGDGEDVYPRPNNPYDASRTPGGSSSGDAIAVATGMTPIGLGSDSGGSLRLPAAWCGVATIKPTTGRVPNTGHFPRIGDMCDPRTAIGPMARSAADLHGVLRVISGVDWRDAGVVPMPPGDPGDVDLRGIRAAAYADMPDLSPTAETADAVRGYRRRSPMSASRSPAIARRVLRSRWPSRATTGRGRSPHRGTHGSRAGSIGSGRRRMWSARSSSGNACVARFCSGWRATTWSSARSPPTPPVRTAP
jgi:amidase